MEWYRSKKAACTNKKSDPPCNCRISLEHHLCFMINKVNSSQSAGRCLWHEMYIMLKKFETTSCVQEAFSRALYRYDTWKCEWTVVSLTFKSESRSKVQFMYQLQSQVFFTNQKNPDKPENKNTTSQITENYSAAYTSNRSLFLFSFT